MNDADILAAWDEGAPPARTAAFRIAVLQKLEARRVAQRLILLAGLVVAATAALVLIAPQLDAAAQSVPANTGLIALAAVAVGAPAWGLLRAFSIKLI